MVCYYDINLAEISSSLISCDPPPPWFMEVLQVSFHRTSSAMSSKTQLRARVVVELLSPGSWAEPLRWRSEPAPLSACHQSWFSLTWGVAIAPYCEWLCVWCTLLPAVSSEKQGQLSQGQKRVDVTQRGRLISSSWFLWPLRWQWPQTSIQTIAAAGPWNQTWTLAAVWIQTISWL